jgi:uncharacterized membrane protein
MTEASPGGTKQALAAHEAESVDSLAAFHLDHYRSASLLQQAMDWLTDRLGRPLVVLLIFLGLVGWAVAGGLWRGQGVGDAWFAWLELAATIAALVVAMLILVTQRRDDQLAERRAQLTLELALIADKKSSKIIALLEELRQDHPNVVNRVDAETAEMAEPADPRTVLEQIDRQARRPAVGGAPAADDSRP